MNDIIDNFWEHEKHFTHDPQCSECYRENRMIKARALVNEEDPTDEDKQVAREKEESDYVSFYENQNDQYEN